MHQSPLKQSGPRRDKYGDSGLADDGEPRAQRRVSRPADAKALRRALREEFAFDVKPDRARK